jgi:hypothetical protein
VSITWQSVSHIPTLPTQKPTAVFSIRSSTNAKHEIIGRSLLRSGHYLGSCNALGSTK